MEVPHVTIKEENIDNFAFAEPSVYVTIKQENVDSFGLTTKPSGSYESKVPDSMNIKVETVKIEPCSSIQNLNDLDEQQHFPDHNKRIVKNDSDMLECLQLKCEPDLHENPESKSKIKCEFCDFTAHEDILKNHMVTHENSEKIDKHPQNQGDYQTTYESYLNNQISKPEDPKPTFLIKCDQCNYETVSVSKIHRHIRKHNDSKCNQCDYQTYNKTNLRQHILKHKESVVLDLYKCDQCTYQTRYEKCWRRHLLNSHKNM